MPFPSYSFLTILYPWIYNNLIVIENLIDKKKFPDFEEKNREKFTINKLKEIIKDLINKNEKGFELKGENMNIILPKNLFNYKSMGGANQHFTLSIIIRKIIIMLLPRKKMKIWIII